MRIDEHLALVGLYVVKKEFRFKGYGKLLWQTLMSHVGHRILALYSVDYRIDAYKKLGFCDPTFTVCIYGATVKRNENFLKNSESVSHTDPKIEIIDIRKNAQLIDHLIEYDSTIHTTLRIEYIKECIGDKENIALLAAVDKSWLDDHNNYSSSATYNVNSGNHSSHLTSPIKGYGFLIKRYIGHAITPLYADTPFISQVLYQHLVDKVPDGDELEVLAPVKILKNNHNNDDEMNGDTTKNETLKFTNNRLKIWADKNWNNSHFTNIKIKITVYRMYKMDHFNNNEKDYQEKCENSRYNNVYSDSFEKYEADKEEETGNSNDAVHNNENKMKLVNRWGVGLIPVDKVYSVSSLEAYWI
ncbi:unnamed protein product [Gordionus sp. m RMFG-2023]|uniref:uncharacterized protein LOC135928370 n=1 Tax=Gordionus sp. m RMFG-2023 TaxID=3053472 RepID=UPI0030E56DA7